ncbi:DUF4139 domain-containing protein [Sphingomonas sp. CFBP 13720]|uniref:DUF4139 domain-containing protein n=1 Tax=Sphingomonas sp. CFBP 13720 TaxID=2775302 RepID=UPI00178189FE|nr:hypothetical protein [Sphingomonas sp. CFBP 13720]MBD8678572.1 hypothetical protein [Sphingomonas sp. CFBP 13720]
MRRAFALSLLLAVASPGAAAAQGRVVTSASPDRVALTVYRAPYGQSDMNLNYLQGFALVSETRRIRLPRGPAVLRFEGVAEGIVPVSAVIDGLPGGVGEKNRDARLLSPAALIDGTLGRRVTLTRTHRATGRQISEDATIVAGPARGVVVRTATGVEALRCSGLREKLAFDAVPAGLSAKPVLSVTTVSPVARTVTVRLSYLASGFDWRANYVATIPAGGGTIDLFAWLTLANGDGTAFADADVSAVAGRLNRVFTRRIPAEVGALRLSCYPLGTTTSDLRHESFEREIVMSAVRVSRNDVGIFSVNTPPPPPAPAAPPPPEDLGDLKLYRVPERVTVTARGQKQVALLARDTVPFERRYRRAVAPGQMILPTPTALTVVLRNRKDAGLGLPLPAGGTAVYAVRPGGDRLLVGQGRIDDRAEGETVRISAGVSSQVQLEQRVEAGGDSVLRVTNANPWPVTIDVPIGRPGSAIKGDRDALVQVDGVMTWSPTVPAHAEAELRYR